jgi:hypothetical protein
LGDGVRFAEDGAIYARPGCQEWLFLAACASLCVFI